MSGTLAAGAYRYARLGQKSRQAKNAKKASLPLKSVRKAKKPYSKKAYSKSTSKSLSKRLSDVERKQNNLTSLLVYKVDTKDTLRPNIAEAIYGYLSAVSTSQIESALASCRFFDPSAPGTLITASLASPTYTQKITVSVHSRLVIRNNYQVPCVVTCGLVRPRVDTSITPNQALINSWTDAGAPDQGSTLLSYSDGKEFRELYRGKLKALRLEPGQQVVMSSGAKQFEYDPSYTDSETETYTKRNRSAIFVYRCQGVLGHDISVSTQQGMLPAGIDVYCANTYYIRYNSGGASVKTIVLSEGASQTFTNQGVVSSKPVADNIGYAVS